MIKIDIVSGFLGSGKTTFIKKLLEAYATHKEKVVLIENEFGEIGIDGELIEREGFTVYEISKGCICCTMKNDFVITLSRIIGEIKPDRIIFEPSGIFVPDEIIDMLKSPEFSSTCVLNSLITVVDCVNFLKQNMKFSFFFERQIMNATLLLLSKTQLVPAPIVTEVVDKLCLINKQAKIISIDWSGIDSNNIFGLLDSQEKSDIDILLHSESCNCGSHQHHSQCNHNHSHNDEFDTFSLKTSKVFNLDDLEVALHKLTSNEYGDILRGKGFIKADKGFHEFSYTNGQFTINNYLKETSARVCFIGKNLDKTKLRSAFEI